MSLTTNMNFLIKLGLALGLQLLQLDIVLGRLGYSESHVAGRERSRSYSGAKADPPTRSTTPPESGTGEKPAPTSFFEATPRQSQTQVQESNVENTFFFHGRKAFYNPRPAYPVRNTFIHYHNLVDPDDSEDTIPVKHRRRAESLPGKLEDRIYRYEAFRLDPVNPELESTLNLINPKFLIHEFGFNKPYISKPHAYISEQFGEQLAQDLWTDKFSLWPFGKFSDEETVSGWHTKSINEAKSDKSGKKQWGRMGIWKKQKTHCPSEPSDSSTYYFRLPAKDLAWRVSKENVSREFMDGKVTVKNAQGQTFQAHEIVVGWVNFPELSGDFSTELISDVESILGSKQIYPESPSATGTLQVTARECDTVIYEKKFEMSRLKNLNLDSLYRHFFHTSGFRVEYERNYLFGRLMAKRTHSSRSETVFPLEYKVKPHTEDRKGNDEPYKYIVTIDNFKT